MGWRRRESKKTSLNFNLNKFFLQDLSHVFLMRFMAKCENEDLNNYFKLHICCLSCHPLNFKPKDSKNILEKILFEVCVSFRRRSCVGGSGHVGKNKSLISWDAKTSISLSGEFYKMQQASKQMMEKLSVSNFQGQKFVVFSTAAKINLRKTHGWHGVRLIWHNLFVESISNVKFGLYSFFVS